MARGRLAGGLGILALLLGGLLAVGLSQAQQIHRNGFETLKMGWLKGGFDAPYQENAHVISDEVAHDGRHSEHLKLDVQPRPGAGDNPPFIHYAYPTGKAVIGEELAASIWLKSNRAGMQLMARVVLPRERDPQNLDQLLTTYIRGDIYQQVGQWQRLELTRPVQLAKQQQQLMQKALQRPIDFTDAYIDGLILNVYGGPGPTDIWIDDVEVGPIASPSPFQPAIRPNGPTDAKPIENFPKRADNKGLPSIDGQFLKVGNRPFLFRGIFVTDTPLEKLMAARFNTAFLPEGASPGLLRDAASRDLWVVPNLRVLDDTGKPLPPEDLAKELSRYNDLGVLFTNLGRGTLPYEQNVLVKRMRDDIKQFDPGLISGGDVWDGMHAYSRTLSLVGVHRWPLMTTLELPAYRDWLKRRRMLATHPGVVLWTSVQTHLPDTISQAIYERPATGAFDEPVGPQAEHVQLLTYTALAAGCKGLVFSSDRFLADSHQGRDRLLACALTNLELEMLEPLLAGADDAPEWVDTSAPDVKAAIIRSRFGVLVLPVWEGPFSQFVPGQAALSKLYVKAPPMPHSMQAWEVTPADVRHLKTERVVDETKVTVPEFGLSTAIVFTSSTELVARFQEQAKGRRQLAAQWAHDMAAYEMDKVLKVQDQLNQLKQAVPDAPQLIANAQQRLKLSRQLWESRAFAEAYQEAQRALRPLRILMRAQWEKAVRGMDSPVVSPYTASYFTLPRHWQFVAQVQPATASWGKNVLPGGDFETPPQAPRPEDTWRLHDPTPLDEVELIALRVGEVSAPEIVKEQAEPDKGHSGDAKDGDAASDPDQDPGAPHVKAILKAPPKEGKFCAMLKIQPRGKAAPPLALERTLLALNSPVVRLQPGSVVRVSGWMCIPKQITASPDGALLYDSAGGDAFAVRLTRPTGWKKFTVYRRVPASGAMQITLALTGLGTVFFDDIRIEPLN
jgi:hypothetical protein